MISILGIIWTGTVGLNCDFPGNDFKQVQTSNSIKCHSICKNTIGCTSYTWNSFSRTCFLKEKIVSISDAYFVGEWLHESYLVVCGIISVPTKNRFYQKLPKTRFFSHYAQSLLESVEKCWEECNARSTCKAITYANSTSNCFFYDDDSAQNGFDFDEEFTSITSKTGFKNICKFSYSF